MYSSRESSLMSKLNWPLATVLLIAPLAASCNRTSSEQGLVRDESPKAATSGAGLVDLVAIVRQVQHLHRMRQLQALRHQEQQLVPVAFPLPEKQEPDVRPLLDEKTVAELQQQLLQIRAKLNSSVRFATQQTLVALHRLDQVIEPYREGISPDAAEAVAEEPAEGGDDQQPSETVEAEGQVTESPSDALAPPDPSPLLDRLALSRTVLQAPVHRLRCRIASLPRFGHFPHLCLLQRHLGAVVRMPWCSAAIGPSTTGGTVRSRPAS
jgi:hypothetical protein